MIPNVPLSFRCTTLDMPYCLVTCSKIYFYAQLKLIISCIVFFIIFGQETSHVPRLKAVSSVMALILKIL